MRPPQPSLEWARGRFDIHFETVAGVMHRAQPAATVQRLAEAVTTRDAFTLAGLSHVVTVTGSLVLALALVEGAIDAEDAWTAAQIDEAWQAEQWGEDAEESARLARRRADFLNAARYCALAAER